MTILHSFSLRRVVFSAALLAALLATLQATSAQAQSTSSPTITGPAQKSYAATSSPTTAPATPPKPPASQAGSSNPLGVNTGYTDATYSGLMVMGCRVGTPVGGARVTGKPEDVWTCINETGLKACEMSKPAKVKQCYQGQPKNYP
jgi:hypothetical protein